MEDDEEGEEVQDFRNQKVTDYMEGMLDIIPVGFVVEVAQYLISNRVKLPEALTTRLV